MTTAPVQTGDPPGWITLDPAIISVVYYVPVTLSARPIGLGPLMASPFPSYLFWVLLLDARNLAISQACPLFSLFWSFPFLELCDRQVPFSNLTSFFASFECLCLVLLEPRLLDAPLNLNPFRSFLLARSFISFFITCDDIPIQFCLSVCCH